MLIEKVAKLKPKEIWKYWIKERESIRIKKESGKPPPWTDDGILQNFRFTNVVRNEDKVSKWLIQNYYKPHYDDKRMPVLCAFARHINSIDSMELVDPHWILAWRPEKIRKVLKERREIGAVFNNAYMIRGGHAGEDKVDTVIDVYVGQLIKEPLQIDRDSVENTWANLRQYFGMGSFMAGQIVFDLSYAMKGKWKDRDIWAPLGPGSRRGMNRLMERDLNCTLSQKEFEKELLDLIEYGMRNFPDVLTSRMDALSWQSSLCELDKYMRCLYNEGRPKQRYNGTASMF